MNEEIQTKKDRTKKILSLEIIRGVSAIMIVLYHYTTQYDGSIGHVCAYPINLPWGCYAVYTFFILSGFLTFYQLKDNTNPITFLKKRFIRLYPVFWVSIAVTTVYMMVLLPERVRSPIEIIANATMIPNFLNVPNVDGAYWTLEKELMFYVIIAALIKVYGSETKEKIKRGGISWIVIIIMATLYANSSFDLPAESIVSFLFITKYAQMFLIGIEICILTAEKDIQSRRKAMLVIGICLLYTYLINGIGQGVFTSVMVILITWVVDKELNRNNQLKHRWKRLFSPILYIASISYPLYLTHQFIGFGIINYMERTKGLVGEGWLIVPILQAIVLASVLHYLVEQPITKLLTKRYLLGVRGG